MSNPQLKAQIDAAQQQTIMDLEKAHKYDETKPVISREKALEQMRVMENKKVDALKELQEKSKTQMIQQQQV